MGFEEERERKNDTRTAFGGFLEQFWESSQQEEVKEQQQEVSMSQDLIHASRG